MDILGKNLIAHLIASLDPVLRADVCELESGSGVCLSFLLIVVIPGNSTFEDFFFGGGDQTIFLIACACFRLLISMWSSFI